jgi:CDP-glycerol glycerophosphotransferase
MTYDISVIIPTYNVENYITEALSSIQNQTFKGNLEVIVIDDCSTDNTVKVVEEFQDNYPELSIRLLRQSKNMRQGTARNRGIKEARGKYIFFLDGDDFIDPNTFDKMFQIAENNECDFVLCDWIYYYEDDGLVYVNNEDFLFRNFLKGKEVEYLLKANTYFTVNKLYNKNFLESNNIRYGEGYIYEDFEFYVKVAQYGENVGIVSNPFYRVRVNNESTTKTNTNTTLHVDSLVKAIENTIRDLNPRSEYSYYHLYKYLVRKSLSYLDTRAPRGYKRKTLKKILKLLNEKKSDYVVPKKLVPLYHLLFRRKYIQNNKVNKILFTWFLYRHGKLNPWFKSALNIKWKILNSKTGQKYLAKRRARKIQSFNRKPIQKNTILFLGFDYRYVGNSKYLFDYLKNNSNLNLYFVTKNQNVPRQFRVPPRSLKFYEKLAISNIVIVESWVPLAFQKREGQTWIQLWHGTPFKKLFFDSQEFYISNFNRNHKKDKQKDIKKWDYLLADSIGGVEKLSSAFAYDKERILNYGYPRVQWLKDNQNNSTLKNEIRKLLNIPDNKKVILYVPTWRDYNYRVNRPDLSYLLDVQKLNDYLQNEYVIIYKEHSMGSKNHFSNNIIIPDNDIETQKLLLVSDLVISDYSSIIFDILPLNKPFYLFINDFDAYSKARGVYEDMHRLLSSFYVNNEEDLCKKIINIEEEYPKENYDKVKQLYGFIEYKNSNQLLENKIMEIINKS